MLEDMAMLAFLELLNLMLLSHAQVCLARNLVSDNERAPNVSRIPHINSRKSSPTL